jgi:hypothetical protein
VPQTGPASNNIDLVRTARMASFGLLFYGPLQHRWYGLLASRFPGTSTGNFLSKVQQSGLMALRSAHPTSRHARQHIRFDRHHLLRWR